MALKIVWTTQAENGLDRVVTYLEKEWTKKEVVKLEQNLKAFLKRICKYPKIYPVTDEFKNMHKGLVDKNNYIIYRLQPQKGIIVIINFRGTKEKPLE